LGSSFPATSYNFKEKHSFIVFVQYYAEIMSFTIIRKFLKSEFVTNIIAIKSMIPKAILMHICDNNTFKSNYWLELKVLSDKFKYAKYQA
jgi:hypothetical protein